MQIIYAQLLQAALLDGIDGTCIGEENRDLGEIVKYVTAYVQKVHPMRPQLIKHHPMVNA